MHSDVQHSTTREPAVAGLFYPHDPSELTDVVQALMMRNVQHAALPSPALALIVPHAGYIYSGATAGAAYALIAPRRATIRRVVLIGPSHRVYLRGIAVPQTRTFLTPLGPLEIDQELKARVLRRGDVVESDVPHELEHCLEVQLPFLQCLLDSFTLLPLVAGSATPEHVAGVLADAWSEDDTLLLVSSDLSHYNTYSVAQRLDAATSAAILRFDTAITGDQACGAVGINGLTRLAPKRKLAITEIARCNSGDTAGDRNRVVGYGAFAVHEPHASAS